MKKVIAFFLTWIMTCIVILLIVFLVIPYLPAKNNNSRVTQPPTSAETTTPLPKDQALNTEVDYAPNSILVHFAPGTPRAEKELAKFGLGGRVKHKYTLVQGLENWKLPPGLEVAEAQAVLERNPNVLYAEPDYAVTADLIPNDPYFNNMDNMNKINAPTAWDQFTGNKNFVVAMIDTGVDYTHPDLAANVWRNPDEIPDNGKDDDDNGFIDDVYGWDFACNDNDPSDWYNHGSHTAGIVGAEGNNNLGITGVNWNIKLAALKFLDDSGNGFTSTAIAALQYAIDEGIQVSNNSWGTYKYSRSMYNAIDAARSAGHLFVAASGNYNNDNDLHPFYPASYDLDNIISVAATDALDAKASFSNFGSRSVDLAAPGVGIYSTIRGGYKYMSGTSMATPHIAGVAALVFGFHPDWTYQMVRDAIFITARPISSLDGKTVTGGVADAAAALNYVPPAAPTGTMHLGGLYGFGTNSLHNKWRASVIIRIRSEGTNAPVAGATVTGTWSGNIKGTASCVTIFNGTCFIENDRLNENTMSEVTFTVDSVTHDTVQYDPTGNQVNSAITIYNP